MLKITGHEILNTVVQVYINKMCNGCEKCANMTVVVFLHLWPCSSTLLLSKEGNFSFFGSSGPDPAVEQVVAARYVCYWELEDLL